MQVEISGLGNVTYDESELLYFKEGLYGFDDLHKYLPVPFEESDRIFILQSIEEPMISFVLMNPFMILDDYDPVLLDKDIEDLGNPSMDDISFYIICSLKSDIGESTLNLKCPIAVNATNKQAKQIILEDSKYQLRHRFKDYEIKNLLQEG